MTSEKKDSAEELIDLLVYAPIGLALEYRTLLPELAERGRKQLGFARSVGKLALGGLAAQADRSRRDGSASSSTAATDTGATKKSGAEPAAKKPGPKKTAAKKPAAKKRAVKKAAPKKPAAKKPAAKNKTTKKAAAKKPAAKRAAAKKKAPSKKKTAAAKSSKTADADVNAVLATYDTLTARNIVGRLEGLSATQLQTVADYERSNRQRTTVLNRIEQLLG